MLGTCHNCSRPVLQRRPAPFAGANILERALQNMDPFLVSGIRKATTSGRKFIQETCELIASAVRRQVQLG